MKCLRGKACFMATLSRPTRGAWIEMMRIVRVSASYVVAPHAGRVD